MIHGPHFPTSHEAYVATLRHIMEEHQYETVGRGKTALEVINTSFVIDCPTARMPMFAARRANPVFAHAEALWYLSGRDDAEMIGYYAPRLRDLAGADGRLTGTAYGPRLFAAGRVDRRSQFDRVEALLRADPDTKRAAMVIMRPDELVDPGNPDVACTLGLQFLLREGALHLSAYMRGNDAFIGLLGDTFAFTFIQEFAARRLDVLVGTYAHHVGSMHINVLDVPKVHAILNEDDRTLVDDQLEARPRFPVDPMPPTTWEMIDTVMSWEERLRTDCGRLDAVALAGLNLPPYWQRILALFEVYRQIAHRPDVPVDRDSLDELAPAHLWLVSHRWPERMPRPAAAEVPA